MIEMELLVRTKAIERLAKVFGVDVSELKAEVDLTTHFTVKPSSFFKRNEFDIISDDINDVANNRMLKKIRKGEVEIRTVGEYVNYMIECYRENPKMVESVLGVIEG